MLKDLYAVFRVAPGLTTQLPPPLKNPFLVSKKVSLLTISPLNQDPVGAPLGINLPL